MTLYPNLILEALSTVRYPGTGKNIVEMGMVADDIRIDGNKVSFSLIFQRPTDPFIKSIVRAAEVAINTHIGEEVEIKGNISVATLQPTPEKKKEDEPPISSVQTYKEWTIMQKTNNLQDIFLTKARKENVPVTLFLVNGFQLRGVITGFDCFVVVLDSEGRQQVIYKHAISTIAPARNVTLWEDAE